MRSLTDQLEDSDDRADMTPLIDCVFLLLLFFIVAATFSEQTLFDVQLPKASGAEVAVVDDAALRVAIADDGSFAIADELVPEERLYEAIRERHLRAPIEALVIEGDKASPLERAVQVIDVAHALDIGFAIIVEH